MPAVRPVVRSALRPLLGRERPLWRFVRSPALRFAAFRDPLDCLIHALLISLPRVRFLQIGANDGRTGDRLWTFRRFPAWSGTLVEPHGAVFQRLAANYGPWPERFHLVNAAVASTPGVRPFYHLGEGQNLPGHTDQLGSLDESLLDRHRRELGLGDGRPLGVSEVLCVTLPDLLEQSGAVNLVVVDAEGSDAAILARMDLATHRPEVVAYEHVHLTEEDREATAARLEAGGYALFLARHDTLGVSREGLRRLPRLARAWAVIGPR